MAKDHFLCYNDNMLLCGIVLCNTANFTYENMTKNNP